MESFDLVLGQTFSRMASAAVFPQLERLVIMDPKAPCMVNLCEPKVVCDTAMLSAISLEKSLKKKKPGHDMFMAAMIGDWGESAPIDESLPDEIKGVLEDFADVMPAKLPDRLPPRRAVDHKIKLLPGSKPPALRPYRLSQVELAELKRQLEELVSMGYMRPSHSPYGASALFERKPNGELRMCLDYRALNKQTVRNRYPLPLIDDCFDRLGEAVYFTKLDLKQGYYQVRIAEGDEQKTMVVTRYGSFDFMVMPFGLCNAPATFCTLMNDVFRPFLDKFVVVYLDDILVFSKTLEEHKEHLAQVFQKLRENDLFVKREKCTFAQNEVQFLGHILSGGKVRPDPKKLSAI